LQLFSPNVLDLLKGLDNWYKVKIFRSVPGAGKTSLFRLLSPSVLTSLYNSRSREEIKPLFRKLKELGFISDDGPTVFGINISCARNYSVLEDLNFDKPIRERLFIALLNSRIVLAALRETLEIKKLKFPEDLDKIQVKSPTKELIPPAMKISLPCSGLELYKWAVKIETDISEAIDSFGLPSAERLTGHDSLYSLFLINQDCLFGDDSKSIDRSLLMIDDLHILSANQRSRILQDLFTLRPQVGVWIAERPSALTPEEHFVGASEDREYQEIQLIVGGGKSNRFQKIAENISSLRIRLKPDFNYQSFENLLPEAIEDDEWNLKARTALKTISKNVLKRIKESNVEKYDIIAKFIKSSPESDFEKAILWQSLEIVINREKSKGIQLTFGESEDIQRTEMEQRITQSDISEASKYFITQSYKIPYYCGRSKLYDLAFFNIEQFLHFSGEVFEEILSKDLLGDYPMVHPNRQEEMIKKVTGKLWNEIPKRIKDGYTIQAFLKRICSFAYEVTNRSNAPYAPGITGIGIKPEEYSILANKNNPDRNNYSQLLEILATCLSYNLLMLKPVTQGSKGDQNNVLYLNRWLCVKFRLPLSSGGWRPVSLSTLREWTNNNKKTEYAHRK